MVMVGENKLKRGKGTKRKAVWGLSRTRYSKAFPTPPIFGLSHASMRLHAYVHTRMSGDADIGPYADILTDTDTYP
jgi:hypothetical protein